MSVSEYIWKSKRLEKKINVRHRDLVKKAITQTNTNMFYINRSSVEANGKVSVKIDHCHNQDADDYSRSVKSNGPLTFYPPLLSRGLKSPEYHLVGPGRKLLLRTSQLQCGSVCDDNIGSESPPLTISRPRSQTSSVPDITRRVTMGTIYRSQELDTIDPYGPMSGRNLVSIVDDLGEELSEADSYLVSRQSTPGPPGHRHRPPEPPTYHQPGLYCDLHCRGKHEVTRRSREAGVTAH